MSRIKKLKEDNKAVWIAESRDFFTNVIKDTLENLRNSSTGDISRTERRVLGKLEAVWLKNYKPKDHIPNSNPCPLPQVPRKPRLTSRKRKPIPSPDEPSVEINTLDDNEQILYRIQIPPLRPHWQCRSIDLTIPVYVCKHKLIEPLINWKLLNTIMEAPLNEAPVIFQDHIDTMLHFKKDDD